MMGYYDDLAINDELAADGARESEPFWQGPRPGHTASCACYACYLLHRGRWAA